MKKALVIGIDDYPDHALNCCVNDATEVAALLKANGDKTRNFDVDLRTSTASSLTNQSLEEAISRFFKSNVPAETAVLYFAGHGIIDSRTDAGCIMGTDTRKGALGLHLSDLLALANAAYPTIHSSVLILDCCHAGFLGETTGAAMGGAALVGQGVAILSSSHDDETDMEGGQGGVFTLLLLEALHGGCADLRGDVQLASVHAFLDQSMSFGQRTPIYKTNLNRPVTLRKVAPVIPAQVLRRIAAHFPHPNHVYELDPSYEPARSSLSEKLKSMPHDPEHAQVFGELQLLVRHGLVVPVDASHMYSAAMESKACALTPMGKHYQRLAARKKL